MYVKHDRNKVLQEGLQLLYQKGYNALGVDEICKTTGMTKGAFYNAFQSKQEFLAKAMQLYGEKNVQRINLELNKKTDDKAFEKLKSFYKKMLEVQPNVNYIGCFINNVMSELGVSNQIIADSCHGEFQKFIQSIEPMVKKAQQEGDLPSDISTKDLTELIHSTFYGALTIAKSSKDVGRSLHIMELLFKNLNSNRNG